MFGRGLQMAMLASALVSGSNTGPIAGWGGSDYERQGRRSKHHYTEDLTRRPTPPLAPEKPLTKRQKRRLRGKR